MASEWSNKPDKRRNNTNGKKKIMCLAPTLIPNPYYRADPTKAVNYLHDCTSLYLKIPCGKCGECIAVKQMEYVQQIQMESLYNWLYMATLTYSNDAMPYLETSEGWIYRYAEYTHIQRCIDRLRESNAFGIPFRYFIVSERGGKSNRPHFHCLLLFKKDDIGKNFLDCLKFEQEHKWDIFNEWRINWGSKRRPVYQNLCEYHESYRGGKIHKTYDFHWVNPALTDSGVSDVAFYVLKYMLKGMENEKMRQAIQLNYEDDEAQWILSKVKNMQRHSLGFGFDAWDNKGLERNEEIQEYLRKGVQRSKKVSEYPYYYCPEQLLTFPLARRYKNDGKIFTLEDKIYWFEKSHGDRKDWVHDEEKNIHNTIKKFKDYEKRLRIAERSEVTDYFDEIENDLFIKELKF